MPPIVMFNIDIGLKKCTSKDITKKYSLINYLLIHFAGQNCTFKSFHPWMSHSVGRRSRGLGRYMNGESIRVDGGIRMGKL